MIGRRLQGLHRWQQEHFSLFAGSAITGRVREIAAPALHYYADPFLWTREGVTALFFEDFDYLENTGHLSCRVLNAKLEPGEARTVIQRARHASFPFLFEHGGLLYMVPETCHEGCVDLYLCEEFPYRWRLLRRLLDGVDAADSVLLQHAQRWWLLTSLREHGSAPRYLGLFSADELLHGDWRPHPLNSERRFADEAFRFGRNAGAPLHWHGAWLRPVQANVRYYGQGMRWMRITTLDESAFREEPFDGRLPLAQLAAHVSPHHICSHSGLVAWDVRDRVSYWRSVPLARASADLALSGLGTQLAGELRCSG